MRFIILNRYSEKGFREMTRNEENARIFKGLCDPNRLTILELLCDGEKCGCHLLEELKIGQPTLSHHMKILCESGLVKIRKDGKWSHYSLDTDGIEFAKETLTRLTTPKADANNFK